MVTKKRFGYTMKGNEVWLYKLQNDAGAAVEIINYGGAVVSIMVPDDQNRLVDVVLGYDSVAGYETGEKYIGAIVGRYCNRIDKGRFMLNGQEFQLTQNDGQNHLHGGFSGFDKKLWNGRIVGESLELTCESADGEEGYPGHLRVRVIYTFDNENSLHIQYYAVSDKDTIVSLTNHSYFNLDGYKGGNILKQLLKIHSDRFTPANQESIPNGEMQPVAGTPMDFRTLTPMGKRIDEDFRPLQWAKGYDHNWCINHEKEEPTLAAYAASEESGITLTVFTTMPGVHFYTGNYLDGAGVGKKGIEIKNRSGFCLETQYYPNSPCISGFLSPVLKAGEPYLHQTIFRFGVRNPTKLS